MNIKGFTFDITYVAHRSKWSVIVKEKGVRMNVPFLIECGDTMDEVCSKLLYYTHELERKENLNDLMNGYENKHRKDAG